MSVRLPPLPEGDREGQIEHETAAEWRLRRLENDQRELERKVDRLQWTIVAAAFAYLASIWTGIGGPT